MCDPWTTGLALITMLCAVAEFGLRLSTLQPRLRRCPWREWPQLLWQTMLDDRIYLMGPLSKQHPPKGDQPDD